jgi:hypothetical protein
MSRQERERLKIFERVKRGELQQQEAAALCHLGLAKPKATPWLNFKLRGLF